MGSTTMTPKELSEFDDIATAVIVDPYLGFGTHKMSTRFRSPRQIHQSYLKSVVTKFQNHQNYETAYADLLGCEWFASIVKRKKKDWQNGLKEHVRYHLLLKHIHDMLSDLLFLEYKNGSNDDKCQRRVVVVCHVVEQFGVA